MWDDEIEYMDTSEVPWVNSQGTQWYYLADCGRWHRFEDDPDNCPTGEDVEKHYQRNRTGSVCTYSSSCRIKLDFSAMLQTDLTTGRNRRILRSSNIERSCSCFSAAPDFWDAVDVTRPYQLIILSKCTPEYQTVASYVKNDGLLDRSILSIIRIQNLDLWELYCRKKKQLMRLKGVKEIQERRVFHGTRKQHIDSICKYNFDVRLARPSGSYGQGIYFARYASYADTYSMSSTDPLPVDDGRTQRSQSGSKIIFLARVMIGKPTVGKLNIRKPDHNSHENTHDSCVDDINNPKVFIVFDSNQIYPEYLIHYQ